jgi:hypothetical protein
MEVRSVSTAIEDSRAKSDGDGEAPAKLRTLFFLHGSEYLATFRSVILALLARGHEVLVALDHERRGRLPSAARILDELGKGQPGFRYLELPPRRDVWRIPANSVRRGLDYLRYLEPEYAGEDKLRARARERAPRVVLALLVLPPFRWPWGRHALGWVLRRVDAATPVPRWLKAFIGDQRPDAVVVSPLVDFGSGQSDYVRRASAQRIPSVLLVAGADDLRSKGAIRDVPTLTVVSSSTEADQAVRLQGLPPDRVVDVAGDSASPEARVVDAIERAVPSRIEPSHRGMLLRPILVLLTPLLLLLLPLLRPRTTARGVTKWARDRRRMRRHKRREAEVEATRRVRQHGREAREKAARLRHDDAAKAKAERAREKAARAKEHQRKQVPAVEETEKAEPAPERPKPKPQAGEAKLARAEKKAKAKANLEEKATSDGKAKDEPAKGGAVPLGRSLRRTRGRIAKQARGRARAVRRGARQARRSVKRTWNRRYRFTYQKTITRVPARDELPALLNARGLLGKGVEIGVKTGKYSEELLRNWHGEELISIDPWMSVDWDEYVDRSNVSQDEFERYYQITRERLAHHGDRSTIWRTTSVEGAKFVPDHSLDFAYIDARHDYESVKEDIAAWCAKVRPGGILAGHDYVDGDFPEGEFYVKSAVDEFFGERGIPVHGTDGPSAVESFPTWIVVVPESGIEPRPPAEPPQ